MNIKPATLGKPQIAGRRNPNWRGGTTVRKDGRVMVHSPNHPSPSHGKYVYRYRLVVEESLGRFLKPDEVVHHKNGIVNDDRLENLEMMPAIRHNRFHAHNLFHQMKWARNYDRCVQCGTDERRHGAKGFFEKCYEARRAR